MPGRISPTSERQAGALRGGGGLGVLLSFGIFRAAVFAEPAVSEVEEMVGLNHKGELMEAEEGLIENQDPRSQI